MDDPETRIGRPNQVIVGIDGSRQSRHALEWALAKALTLGVVTPISAFEPAPLEVGIGVGRAAGDLQPSVLREAATARMNEALAGLDRATAERARVVQGHPGDTLCGLARSASMLVVGSRGHGAVASALLGSVSAYCVKYSPVPVAVIPEDFPTDRPLRKAIVGVDGSANAEAALRWSLERIEPEGCVLAVGALSMWGYTDSGLDPTPQTIEKQVRRQVERSVDRLRAEGRGWPAIEIVTRPRDARTVLRELADSETDLLVVGARGTTGLPHLILGSVSTAVINQPRVPSVIIPKTPEVPVS